MFEQNGDYGNLNNLKETNKMFLFDNMVSLWHLFNCSKSQHMGFLEYLAIIYNVVLPACGIYWDVYDSPIRHGNIFPLGLDDDIPTTLPCLEMAHLESTPCWS